MHTVFCLLLVKSKLPIRQNFYLIGIWEGKALSHCLVRPSGNRWSLIRSPQWPFLSFSQVISQYLQSTHAPTHSDYTMTLLDVFEVEKEGEKKAFREDLQNRSQFSFGFLKILLYLKCSYGTYGEGWQR